MNWLCGVTPHSQFYNHGCGGSVMNSLNNFPDKSNNRYVILRLLGLTLFAGLILGTIGFFYPNPLPLASTIVGLFLMLNLLRALGKPALVQFAFGIFGIIIFSGLFAGFFQSFWCYFTADSNNALIENVTKDNCTQNSAGATAWASGWFMLISAVIIFALFLGNRKK